MMLFKKGLCLAMVAGIIFSCGSGSGKVTDGFLRINNGAELQSIDPAKATGMTENRVITNILEGLVVPDPQTAKAIPGVAESWDISADGKTYVFHLRDAVWSDGEPLTAYDFEYSYVRTLTPATASEYTSMLTDFIVGAQEFYEGGDRSVLGVKAIDEKTLQLELKASMPFFLEALIHYVYMPVPKHVVEVFGDDWIKVENFVGNGAYVMTTWKLNDVLEMVKNEKYWDAENVQIPGVRFYPIDSAPTAYNMYINGDIDWNTVPPTTMLDELVMRGDFNMAPLLMTHYIVFNNQSPPFDNLLVRQAFNLAVDRDKFVHDVFRTGVATNLLVPPLDGYTGPTEQQPDFAKAKELLAEAGYPNGEGFPEVSYLYYTADANKLMAEYLQNEWKEKLGVTVHLHNEEWKSFLSDRTNHNYQLAFGRWYGDYRDPATYLSMYRTGDGLNDTNYTNAAYDDLIERASLSSDPAARMALLSQAEDLLINEDQAVVPLDFGVSQSLIDTDVWGGWYTNVMDYHLVKFMYRK